MDTIRSNHEEKMDQDARNEALEALLPQIGDLDKEQRGELVEALLNYRRNVGTAWRELGEAWGMSHTTFYTIDRGTRPSDEVLAKFAAYYADFKSTPSEWIEWLAAYKELMSA